MARSNWTQIGAHVVEALGGFGGAVAYMTYRLKRREVRESSTRAAVETARDLTETSLALLEPVRAAALEAEKRVIELRHQVTELEETVKSLTDALTVLAEQSKAERDELHRRLLDTEADRDRLAAELAARNAAVTGAPRPAAGTA
jgi:hypothetical protein